MLASNYPRKSKYPLCLRLWSVKKCSLWFFWADQSIRALGTRLSCVSLARNSFLLRQGPGPVSCPASSLQSPGCIWRALKRSTLVGACVHAYTRRHINFTVAPIHIWPRGYISISDGAPACLSHLPRPPFIPNPLSIGARTQLVPVVFRVDGTQPDPIVSVANFSRV